MGYVCTATLKKNLFRMTLFNLRAQRTYYSSKDQTVEVSSGEIHKTQIKKRLLNEVQKKK
jgi:hypothetical protein